MIIDDDKYLTDEQINRCYNVFMFEDNEEITAAWFDNGRLYIEYVTTYDDEELESAIYEPCLIDDEEDKAKLHYILTGEGDY